MAGEDVCSSRRILENIPAQYDYANSNNNNNRQNKYKNNTLIINMLWLHIDNFLIFFSIENDWLNVLEAVL